jgi:hypothetical protein
MGITIEHPTAESAIEALKKLPASELAKLMAILLDHEPQRQSDWSAQDLDDLDRATARLMDKRYGPEEGNYG